MDSTQKKISSKNKTVSKYIKPKNPNEWILKYLNKNHFIIKSSSFNENQKEIGGFSGYWIDIPLKVEKSYYYSGLILNKINFEYNPLLQLQKNLILVINDDNFEIASSLFYRKEEVICQKKNIGFYKNPSDVFTILENISITEKNYHIKTTQIQISKWDYVWQIDKVQVEYNNIFDLSEIKNNFSGIYFCELNNINFSQELYEWYSNIGDNKMCIWDPSIIRKINYIGPIPQYLNKFFIYKLSIPPLI